MKRIWVIVMGGLFAMSLAALVSHKSPPGQPQPVLFERTAPSASTPVPGDPLSAVSTAASPHLSATNAREVQSARPVVAGPVTDTAPVGASGLIPMQNRQWQVVESRMVTAGRQSPLEVMVLKDSQSGALDYRLPRLRVVLTEQSSPEIFVKAHPEFRVSFIGPSFIDVDIAPVSAAATYHALSLDHAVSRVHLLPVPGQVKPR